MTLPFLYKNVTPITRDQHLSHKVRPLAAPFALVRHEHLIPATIAEFAVACRELPIFFFQDESGAFSPVFLVGARPQSSAFVTPDGQWSARYIPAYLRRYPFIAGDVSGAETIICIDTTFEGFQTIEGEALFKANGEATDYLTQVGQLVADYSASAKATAAMTAELARLGVFTPITVNVRQNDGSTNGFHGLQVVDEKRFNDLSPKAFADLRSKGYLPAIYSHLISLANLDRLG